GDHRHRALDAHTFAVVRVLRAASTCHRQRVHGAVRSSLRGPLPGSLRIALDLFESSCGRMGCLGVAATPMRFEGAGASAAADRDRWLPDGPLAGECRALCGDPPAVGRVLSIVKESPPLEPQEPYATVGAARAGRVGYCRH